MNFRVFVKLILFVATPLASITANNNRLPISCEILLKRTGGELQQAVADNKWPLQVVLESGRHDSAGLQASQGRDALQQAGIAGVALQGPFIDASNSLPYYRVTAILLSPIDLGVFLDVMDRQHMKANLVETARVAGGVQSRPTIEELREKFFGKPKVSFLARAVLGITTQQWNGAGVTKLRLMIRKNTGPISRLNNVHFEQDVAALKRQLEFHQITIVTESFAADGSFEAQILMSSWEQIQVLKDSIQRHALEVWTTTESRETKP